MLYWNNKEDVQKVQKVLDSGGVLLSSGDTVLGLSVELSQNGCNQLNEVKQRSGKPYLVLIHSSEKLKHFIDQDLSPKVKQLIELSWPGPVTLIFKARQDLPGYMKSESGTIALRVPDHMGLQGVLSDRKGLFSTSANMHTEQIPDSINEVAGAIRSKVGAICLDEVEIDKGLPSTILDCSSGEVVVIRSGEALEKSLKKFIG